MPISDERHYQLVSELIEAFSERLSVNDSTQGVDVALKLLGALFIDVRRIANALDELVSRELVKDGKQGELF